jgi:hypothetical protein
MFAVRFFTTHGKQKQLTAPAPNGVEQPLPCACPKTHGKQGCLPCAFLKSARQ